MAPNLFGYALPRLLEDSSVVDDGDLVWAPDHQPRLTAAQQEAAHAYLRLLDSDPFSPPTDSVIDAEILSLLVEEGKVEKVSQTVVFSASAYREMVDRISAHIKDQGEITVADVRDMFGTSRKYALALMDHMDHARITRRVGDARVLR